MKLLAQRWKTGTSLHKPLSLSLLPSAACPMPPPVQKLTEQKPSSLIHFLSFWDLNRHLPKEIDIYHQEMEAWNIIWKYKRQPKMIKLKMTRNKEKQTKHKPCIKMVETKGNIKNRKYNVREWKQATSVISINECGVFKQFKEKDLLGQKKETKLLVKNKRVCQMKFLRKFEGCEQRHIR